MTYTYGIYAGTRWGLLNNRRQAIAAAKRRRGYVIRNRYEPGVYWDAPTFEKVGEKIADFKVTP